MELSNFNKQMEQSIIATTEGKLTRLPFIKAGINRLLYPKVHNKTRSRDQMHASYLIRIDMTIP